jgi:hypothetical protein
VRGRQIAGRCVLINTGPFPCAAEWKGLVATLESALRLHRHQPGSLTRQVRYLHRRTGGMIGSLSHLVRAAAQLAILEGDEAITRKLMDTIPSTTQPSPASTAPRNCSPSAPGSHRRPGRPARSRRSQARPPCPTCTGSPSPTSSSPAICGRT